MKAQRAKPRNCPFPFWTLTVVVAAISTYLFPGGFEALSYQRMDIFSGQVWRLVTGHLTHASISHLFWNALAFLVLGISVEIRLRRIYPVFLTLNALVLGLGLLFFQTNLEAYCGLSGLVTGLFGYLLLEQWTLSRSRQDRFIMGVCLICALALIGKILWELFSGRATLVYAENFVPVPLAHFLGVLAGVTAQGFLRRNAHQRPVFPGGL